MLTIYVYRGTFDPFHNNHLAISHWCLEQENTTALVLHVNYRAPSKRDQKQPASWQHRSELVQAALSNTLATVSSQKSFSDTLEEIINKYGTETQIIQVMGDDVLNLAKEEPLVHAYAIHQRDQSLTASETPSKLLGKKRISIPLQLPNISSTEIRARLVEGNVALVSDMLPPQLSPLLENSFDYSPLQLSIRLLTLKGITLSDSLTDQLKETFGIKATLSHEPERFQGLSGDLILSVFNSEKQRIAICKLFTHGIEACQNEALGYKALSTLVKTPPIYFVNDNAICMAFIPGHNAMSANDFKRIGLAYKQLHDNSMRDAAIEFPTQGHTIKQKITRLCNKISDITLSNNLKRAFSELVEKHLMTANRLCYTHGDAQPGNTLLTDHEVIFIDVSSANKWRDASRDCHKMVASIHWKSYERGMTSDALTTKTSVAAFLRGYGCMTKSPESNLWSLYWRTHTLILALEKPELPLSQHIINSFKNDFSHLALFDKPTRRHTHHFNFWHSSNKLICHPCDVSNPQEISTKQPCSKGFS